MFLREFDYLLHRSLAVVAVLADYADYLFDTLDAVALCLRRSRLYDVDIELSRLGVASDLVE